MTATSGAELADQLVATGDLTAWQAGQLLTGEEDSFTFGHFFLEEPLGRGASGFVFKARDERGRDRVLKVLHPAIAANPEALERFRREVRATMSVRHPNVLTAIETGFERGLHYLAFEFYEGVDLRELLNRVGRLTPAQTASIISQVAEALQHVADQGMVHRDVKPSNIFISPDGTARLLDLGLARLDQASSESTVTETGQILGTIDYIAPEQAQDGRHADTRSDIYSLGCTMYQCLTGRVPYPEGAVAEKLIQHLTGTPRPITNDEAPAEMSEVVQRAMERNPMDRFQKAEDMATTLSGLFTQTTPVQIPSALANAGVHVPTGLGSTIPLESPTQLDIKLPLSESQSRPGWPLVTAVCFSIVLAVVGGSWYLRPELKGSASIALSEKYPADSVVQVDGVPTDLRRMELGVGPHRLVIAAPGYELYEESFDVLDNIETTLQPTLTPTKAFERMDRVASLQAEVQGVRAEEFPEPRVTDLQRRIHEFAREDPTSETSLSAISLLAALPTHFDRFSQSDINQTDLLTTQQSRFIDSPPKEIVAIFKSDRSHESYDINCVEFLPDGRLFSANELGEYSVRDIATGQADVEGTFSRRTRAVGATTQGLVVINEVGEIQFLPTPEVESHQSLYVPASPENRGVAIAVSADRELVATSVDELVQTFDSAGKLVQKGEVTLPLSAMCFSDGLIACGTDSGEIILLNAATLEQTHSMQADHPIISMATCANHQIALSTEGGTVEIWNTKERERVRVEKSQEGQRITAVTPGAQGHHLIVAFKNSVIDTMDMLGLVWHTRIDRQAQPIRDLCVSPDQKTLAVAGSRFVELYDLTTGRALTVMAKMPGAVTDVACLADGSVLAATCSGLGMLRCNVSQTPSLVETIPSDRDPISIAACPTSPLFLVGTAEGGNYLEALGNDSYRGASIYGQGQVAWSPTGEFTACAGPRRGLVLARAMSPGDPVHFDRLTNIRVTSLVFSPDSKKLAVATIDGSLRFYDVHDWSLEHVESGSSNRKKHHIDWSPDGKLVATVLDEATVLVDVETKSVVATIPAGYARDEDPQSMAFRPDGKELAVTHRSGAITTWDVSTSPPVRTRDPIILAHTVSSICYTPEGRHLLTANSDGTVYVLRLKELRAIR